MKPLNYAILKYFTKVTKASVEDVINDLKEEYSTFKAFNKKDILNTLLTAEANGLIEEIDADLDKSGDLLIYYRATEESKETINYFIED
ncbi:hypothetical protein [Fusobacterium sp.]|uniref:hypothetical protein n=1 Tax=Fusobacterium sp. TaxID=68766 RepID=UPI0026097627|nr:hypothetical protein [Fusobacterium sp.]